MSLTTFSRTLAWDWYKGTIPENVSLGTDAFLETTYSFYLYRSRMPEGLRIGNNATIYLGTMFDVGPRGRMSIGDCALVHGAWIICDAAVDIGDYALISWNVVLMDSYRLSRELKTRRADLRRLARSALRRPTVETPAKPIRIGRNVWIGFECCVLPGVSVGEGSIVGARSVVTEDVPPYTIVAGNPARVIRQLEPDDRLVEPVESAALGTLAGSGL